MINNEELFSSYKCNGDQESFPIGIESLGVDTNIKVIKILAETGADEELVLDVNYIVDLNTDSISTAIDPDSPYLEDYTITIFLDVPFTQETNIVSNSSYDPEILELGFDKNTLLQKQLYESLNRTMIFPASETGADMSLQSQTERALGVFGFDEDIMPAAHPPKVPQKYKAFVEYSTDEFVQLSGKVYISLADSNQGNTPSETAETAFWKMLDLEGSVWVANQVYVVGDIVQYAGYLFVSLTGGAGNTPTIPSGDSEWFVITLKGDYGEFNPWDINRTYLVDEVVKIDGDYYICIIGHIGIDPETNRVYWVKCNNIDAIQTALEALATNQWDSGVKIVATDPVISDYLGKSVSISGDYAIAGAHGEDTGGGLAGAAYIFNRTGTNTWDTGTKIFATDPEAGDYFGLAVSISGDYAIVGAYKEASSTGAAYIYHRTGTNTWDSGIKIIATDPQADDKFGFSVSISGDYAIVGAHGEDAGGSYAGAAYIYRRTGTNTWDSGVKIVAITPATTEYFGYSVSISGDYAIVGAYQENSATGAAYIFNRTGANTWDTGTKIVATDPEPSDSFGFSVSISGDYAIAGAYGEDTEAGTAGAAYIYNRTGTNTWDSGVKIVAINAGYQDYFGYSVSISGDYAIVGAYQEDTGGDSAGAAYIYRRTGANTWDTGTKIIATDPQADDDFGYSVSISGDYAIAGAYGEDTGSSSAGAVYIFIETFQSIL